MLLHHNVTFILRNKSTYMAVSAVSGETAHIKLCQNYPNKYGKLTLNVKLSVLG